MANQITQFYAQKQNLPVQTELYRKRPPTVLNMIALPTEDVPFRVPAYLYRIHTLHRNRAVSFLKMTKAQRIAVQFFILAALLFVGKSSFSVLHTT